MHNADLESWIKLGDGFCFATEDTERLYQIHQDWVIADLATAKAACEANVECVGIHFDTNGPDYLLLRRLGTPNNVDNDPVGRRTCWKLRENSGNRAAGTSFQKHWAIIHFLLHCSFPAQISSTSSKLKSPGVGGAQATHIVCGWHPPLLHIRLIMGR